MDLADLQNSLAQGYSIEEVAQFVCRDVGVQAKMAELGLPSAAFAASRLQEQRALLDSQVEVDLRATASVIKIFFSETSYYSPESGFPEGNFECGPGCMPLPGSGRTYWRCSRWGLPPRGHGPV